MNRLDDTGTLLRQGTTRLLEPAGLAQGELERLLAGLFAPGIDFADLYFELSSSESWSLEEGIVKVGDHQLRRGVGARAVSGERTGFAYSEQIDPGVLGELTRSARAIVRGGGSGELRLERAGTLPVLYTDAPPLASLQVEQKLELLRRIDQRARSLDPAVEQVSVTLSGVHSTILILDAEGGLRCDVRPLLRLGVTVVAARGDRRERGSAGCGGRVTADWLLEEERALELADEAVRQALVNLEAGEAPAGTMTVVLGPGWPGILLHEAVGHGLEGDFNRKGTSAFSGRIGQRVASPLCTVVDDGSLPGRRGSLTMDDEGTPGQCTMLIEKGILRGYMQDRLNARLMGMAPTGNGRRQSYAHRPMPRMTNTFMLAGEHHPEEIIASVDRGLYARNFGGGSVDITSGKFVFSASEAYLIEGGRITRPVRGATLIGNGPDVLTRVSMVGNDLELDPGIGTCGKAGQSVPVGVGQPTLRIDGLTVGGTGSDDPPV